MTLLTLPLLEFGHPSCSYTASGCWYHPHCMNKYVDQVNYRWEGKLSIMLKNVVFSATANKSDTEIITLFAIRFKNSFKIMLG